MNVNHPPTGNCTCAHSSSSSSEARRRHDTFSLVVCVHISTAVCIVCVEGTPVWGANIMKTGFWHQWKPPILPCGEARSQKHAAAVSDSQGISMEAFWLLLGLKTGTVEQKIGPENLTKCQRLIVPGSGYNCANPKRFVFSLIKMAGTHPNPTMMLQLSASESPWVSTGVKKNLHRLFLKKWV